MKKINFKGKVSIPYRHSRTGQKVLAYSKRLGCDKVSIPYRHSRTKY